MPVIIPPTAAVYDPAYSFLNACRARVGQQMPSLAPYTGNILDQTQASTQQRMNNAWRKFQDALCDAGSKKFQESITIKGIPPTASFDPADQSSISWFQCGDGVNLFTNPVLLRPIWLTPLWMSESGKLARKIRSHTRMNRTWICTSTDSRCRPRSIASTDAGNGAAKRSTTQEPRNPWTS